MFVFKRVISTPAMWPALLFHQRMCAPKHFPVQMVQLDCSNRVSLYNTCNYNKGLSIYLSVNMSSWKLIPNTGHFSTVLSLSYRGPHITMQITHCNSFTHLPHQIGMTSLTLKSDFQPLSQQ